MALIMHGKRVLSSRGSTSITCVSVSKNDRKLQKYFFISKINSARYELIPGKRIILGQNMTALDHALPEFRAYSARFTNILSVNTLVCDSIQMLKSFGHPCWAFECFSSKQNVQFAFVGINTKWLYLHLFRTINRLWGDPPVTGQSLIWSFDIIFAVCQNKLFNKHSSCWRFEAP